MSDPKSDLKPLAAPVNQPICNWSQLSQDACKMCSGEACNLCGAGCWNRTERNCQHDVIDRHKEVAAPLPEPTNDPWDQLYEYSRTHDKVEIHGATLFGLITELRAKSSPLPEIASEPYQNFKHKTPCQNFNTYSCNCEWCHDCGWNKSDHIPSPVRASNAGAKAEKFSSHTRFVPRPAKGS